MTFLEVSLSTLWKFHITKVCTCNLFNSTKKIKYRSSK